MYWYIDVYLHRTNEKELKTDTEILISFLL